MSNDNCADDAQGGDPVEGSVDGWGPTLYRFFWFKFEYRGRKAEICVEHRNITLARELVASAYRLRDEEIETL